MDQVFKRKIWKWCRREIEQWDTDGTDSENQSGLLSGYQLLSGKGIHTDCNDRFPVRTTTKALT